MGRPYRPPQTWDTWGNFADWLVPSLWHRTPRSSRRDEGAERACGRVGVCMSVDTERHTLTHTHSHARTHAGPSAAPPAPPPTFVPKQVAFSGPFSAGDFSRPAADRGRGPLVPSRPGRGWGEGAPGSYRLADRVRAGAPGPAPPRRQDRRGRGRRGGTGRAAPPRAALLRPCPAPWRPDLLRTPLSQLGGPGRARGPLPLVTKHGETLHVVRKESPSLTVDSRVLS